MFTWIVVLAVVVLACYVLKPVEKFNKWLEEKKDKNS